MLLPSGLNASLRFLIIYFLAFGYSACTYASSLDDLQSGIYRFKLCDGWVGCSDIGEYLGFNNKSCVAGVPPNSKVYGNTVGPVLRDFEESKHWKSWNVDVLSRGKSGVEVTLENNYTGYGQSRCKNHFMADYSEKKNACKKSEWADRVHLHKDRVKWTLKEVKNTDGCFNIINDEKPDGCLRYLSAQESCDDRYLKLVEKDDGSGLQRWKLEKVGTGTTPNVPSPDIPLPGSMCVSTGPQNCVACCQSKIKDGSFLEDSSCVDIEKYPECDFDPSLVAASGGSDSAGTVSFSPTPGATECTVIEDSVDGKSSIRTVITHLSFPVTTTHPVGLDPNTEYKIQVSCRIGGEEIKSTDTHLLETVESSNQPGIVNLHQTSETSGSFDIVPPSATGSDCDASSYNVVATPSVGKSIKLSVTGTFVNLKNLKTSVPYGITVEAVCKDGSVSQKSPTALLKTVPSPSSSASPSPSSSASPSPSSSASPSPSQSVLSIPAPSFHTISVFGPHPTVSLMVDPGVPDGSTLNLKSECTNGFKNSLQVPASKSETKVQLNTGLPADTTCTFLASISKGSINSKEVSETRILPTSTEETPRLERWTPNYKSKSAEVTVVAPMKPNCTIKSYTVTTTVPYSATLVGRKLLQSPLPAPVTVTAPGPVTLSPISYGISNPDTFNLAVVGNCDDGSKTPEGHLSVTLSCPMTQDCTTYQQDGSCQCKTCDKGFNLNGNTGLCDVQQASPIPPPPPPASTTGGGFVEFEGDATLIKTGELERVDFTFTPPCGDTFKESDPDGTVKCGWEREGSTDLTAASTSIPPGDYKFTVTGTQCPSSQGQVCDWAAHLLKDNPVSATCPQTDGLVVGICRTAIDLKGACGSQCMLKQGETKNLAFTVNSDGSISFPPPPVSPSPPPPPPPPPPTPIATPIQIQQGSSGRFVVNIGQWMGRAEMDLLDYNIKIIDTGNGCTSSFTCGDALSGCGISGLVLGDDVCTRTGGGGSPSAGTILFSYTNINSPLNVELWMSCRQPNGCPAHSDPKSTGAYSISVNVAGKVRDVCQNPYDDQATGAQINPCNPVTQNSPGLPAYQFNILP